MRFELEHGTGECRVGADGLYWVIDAVCALSGPDAPRLYCDGRSLGPFCPENGKWRLQTRVSNRALPITPQSVFTLSPPDLRNIRSHIRCSHMEWRYLSFKNVGIVRVFGNSEFIK